MSHETARVDIHSHLVPGVDDGAPTLDDALESVGRMAALGIRTILTTPHFDASLLSVPAGEERIEEVEAAFQSLVEAAAARHPDVRLLRGFEIMLDEPSPDLSDARVRMAGTSSVLVEWPSMEVPPGTPEVLARLRSRGWRPIVAHPERYRRADDVVALGEAWREAGAVLQVNHASLTGGYGSRAERAAWSLLEAGLVDCLASDHHGRPHLPLQLTEVVDRLEALDAGEQMKMLVRTNPLRLVEDEDPLPVRPVRMGRGWRERIRRFIRSEVS